MPSIQIALRYGEWKKSLSSSRLMIRNSRLRPAAAGAGTPVKKLPVHCGFSVSSSAVLKRARRKAAQTLKASTTSQPVLPLPISCRVQKYSTIAGATPKHRKSDSESSSAPNFDAPFSRRATRPSSMSKKAAVAIASTANLNCPSRAKRIAVSPEQSAMMVRILGASVLSGSLPRRCGGFRLIGFIGPPRSAPLPIPSGRPGLRQH